ncbi:MAG: YihY/virulence factor BrkB family protein [Candidatus Tumulicola sp.]
MLGVLKNVAIGFGRDKVMRLASSVAFAAIFSIAPLMIVIIGIAGWFLGINNGGHGNHLAENALLDQVHRAAGPGASDTIRQMIAVAFNKPRQSIIAQIVGWVTFALGAAALFGALQDSLNAIWQVEATKGGWRQMFRGRAASFLMILVVIFLLLGTFAANASIAFATTHFSSQLGSAANAVVIATANQIVTFIVLAVAFAAIYKVLPDVSIGWRDVWIGALVTALLFLAGEALIALYLSRTAVASAYGAAGSLLAMLLWIYYSSIVLLLGAEFTKVAAGRVQTSAPSTVRKLTEQPAGIDPRSV